LFVGVGELKRQWNSVWTDGQGVVHHDRKKGDGHDNMWSKLVEFALCVPFIVGTALSSLIRILHEWCVVGINACCWD
jgi:hypothetical protein